MSNEDKTIYRPAPEYGIIRFNQNHKYSFDVFGGKEIVLQSNIHMNWFHRLVCRLLLGSKFTGY